MTGCMRASAQRANLLLPDVAERPSADVLQAAAPEPDRESVLGAGPEILKLRGAGRLRDQPTVAGASAAPIALCSGTDIRDL
jgi:hypothetical protein